MQHAVPNWVGPGSLDHRPVGGGVGAPNMSNLNHMSNGYVPAFVPPSAVAAAAAAQANAGNNNNNLGGNTTNNSSASLSANHTGINISKDNHHLNAAMQQQGYAVPSPHLVGAPGMDCDNGVMSDVTGVDRTSAVGAASQYPSASDDQLFGWSPSVLQ